MFLNNNSNLITNVINKLELATTEADAFFAVRDGYDFIISVIGNEKDEFLALHHEMWKYWRSSITDDDDYYNADRYTLPMISLLRRI